MSELGWTPAGCRRIMTVSRSEVLPSSHSEGYCYRPRVDRFERGDADVLFRRRADASGGSQERGCGEIRALRGPAGTTRTAARLRWRPAALHRTAERSPRRRRCTSGRYTIWGTSATAELVWRANLSAGAGPLGEIKLKPWHEGRGQGYSVSSFADAHQPACRTQMVAARPRARLSPVAVAAGAVSSSPRRW